MKQFALTCALVFLASMAQGQTVVGKALVDGKEVNLFSDQTWSYNIETAPDCSTITPKLTFCGNPAHWTSSPKPAPIIAAAYKFNGTLYGQYVIEDLGADLGLTPDTARSAVLQVIKATTQSDPTIILIEKTDFQGISLDTMVYRIKINGMDAVFSNTMFLGKSTFAQIMTYEIGSDYTDQHKAAHAEFVQATQIKEATNG